MDNKCADKIPPIRNYDPLADFFRENLHLKPFWFGVAVFLANVVIQLWMGIRYDLFITPPGSEHPGMLQDYTALVVNFVSVPIVAGLYLWTPIGATELFCSLLNSQVFSSEKAFLSTVDKSRPRFSKRFVFYIFLIASLLYTLSQLGAYLGWVPWDTVGGYLHIYPMLSWARAPFWFLSLYTLVFAGYNVIITVLTLRQLFINRHIRISPLHPDRCGGLSSINKYTRQIAWAIASVGLVISLAAVFEIRDGTIYTAYPVILGIVAYLLFAPVFFFWPLGTAHTAMREAKNTELQRLADRFDHSYNSLKQDINDLGKDLEPDIKKLDDIKKLYSITGDFPVWPFDGSSLRRFFGVITAPLIPALIGILIDLITDFIFT